MNQRVDVVHGALSKEVKRSDPKKKRSSSDTPAAPASHELRETPIEPDPNPEEDCS